MTTESSAPRDHNAELQPADPLSSPFVADVPDDAPANERTRFGWRVVAGALLTATALLSAAVLGLAGTEAALRFTDRAMSVTVVGALLTAAVLLPEEAWTNRRSQIGETLWRIGCVGAAIWAAVAAEGVAERLRAPRETAADPLFGSLAGQLWVTHAVLILITAVAAPFFFAAHRATARRVIAAAAVTAVLALPSGSFDYLPWQARTNDALHGALASIWTGGLIFVVFVGFARVDASARGVNDWSHRRVRNDLGLRPFQTGGVDPSPAYRYLRHAANEFSNVALACALSVVGTGVAMGLGVGEGMTAEVFFADAWGWQLILKAAAAAMLIGFFGVMHRGYGLKRLNGEPLKGMAAAVLRILPKRWIRGMKGETPSGRLFGWLAAGEAVLLMGTLFLGVAMNVNHPPLPPALTIESPAQETEVENHLTVSGSAHLPDDKQLWPAQP